MKHHYYDHEHQHCQQVLNAYHLKYLVNTIDVDSKQTRRDILNTSLPLNVSLKQTDISTSSSSGSEGTSASTSYGDFTSTSNGSSSSSGNCCSELFIQRMLEVYSHFPPTYADGTNGKASEFEALSETRREEFFQLYKGRYDSALNDIQVELLPRVVLSLRLSSTDVLVDLGASTGRLLVATRLLRSDVKHCIGVELSPSRTEIGIIAAKNLASFELGSPSSSSIELICGDICEPQSLSQVGTVYFMGIGRSGRKLHIPKILRAICIMHVDSNIRMVRFICAGHTVERLDGIRFIGGTTFATEDLQASYDPEDVDKCNGFLRYGYAQNNCDEPGPHEDIRHYSKFYETLYGENMGPRVLMEFELDLDVLTEHFKL